MRLLFAVQRYGTEVAGGAEMACREVATRLAARGHEVHVVTSAARSYMTWENEFDVGAEEIDGVIVHRLPTRRPRDPATFDPVNARVVALGNRASDVVQRSWQWLQGPDLPDLEPFLERHAAEFDAAVFFTYLYATTNRGLPVARHRTTTALVPCAHDEPALRLRINRATFERADRHLFLTPEEAALISRTFPVRVPSHTVGLGTDVGLDGGPDPSRCEAFRAEHANGSEYLTFVGRIDPNKGADWLADVHVARAEVRDDGLPLVFVGDPVVELPGHPTLRTTGWVSSAEREAALAASLALVHPSPYESFALTLIETWALGRPVLVHRRSPVLAGQVGRSAGGLLFEDLASYDVAVEALLERDGLAEQLGERGRAYVDRHHRWDATLDRWERALS